VKDKFGALATIGDATVVLIDTASVHKAERLIESCEHCNPAGAEIPFDAILDCVTGSDPSVTEFGTAGEVSELPQIYLKRR
jgi:hypothetical protein